jgi:two-component system, NtrC family, response regulator HydG
LSETAFILIVEEEVHQAEQLAESLRVAGHACRIVHSRDEALDSIRARRPDVIVTDARLGGASNGMELIRESGRLAPDAEIILMDSSPQQLPVPASAGRRIYDYLAKPVQLEEFRRVVTRAAEQAQRNRDQRTLAEQVERRTDFEGIITANDGMIRVIRRLQRVADSKLTVLLLGESGTGKELAARAIHRHSPRRSKAYRAINCAGLNENLLESELFGHVKGAFTGAHADRKGLFEVVDGGTLFLDEVGDMPMPMQAKLLRTLENGEIQPVGANEIRRVDVRVVAATRRDIRAMVEAGDFRDDLFYRLNQAILRLPPLRERREDVPLLVDYFLREASIAHGRKVTGITPEAVRKLTGYNWPGNARQLRSVVEEMVVLAEPGGSGQLDLDDLPTEIRGSTELVVAAGPNTAGLTMEQMERIHIANTLKMTGGNREKTAKMLGIGARTLYRKLREYQL